MGLGKTVQTVVFLYSLYKEVRLMRVMSLSNIWNAVLLYFVQSALPLSIRREAGFQTGDRQKLCPSEGDEFKVRNLILKAGQDNLWLI